MSSIIKHYGKWQAEVRKIKIKVVRSFTNKSDSRLWAEKWRQRSKLVFI